MFLKYSWWEIFVHIKNLMIFSSHLYLVKLKYQLFAIKNWIVFSSLKQMMSYDKHISV